MTTNMNPGGEEQQGGQDSLSDIDRLIDSTEDDGGQTDDQSSREGTGTEDAPQRDPQGQSAPSAGQQRTGESGQGQHGSQQAQPGQEQGSSDPAGDLTLRDGSVIKGGATRRIYQRGLENERLAPQLQEMQTKLQNAEQQVQSYNQAFETIRGSGLNAQESAVAHQLFAEYKKDPARVINHLLTQAKQAGIDVGQVGQGVDVNAIVNALRQEIAPFRQDREAQEQAREREQQVERQYNDFMSRYPDAKPHEDEIGILLEKRNDLSLDGAYYALRNYYQQRGYDWNLPLADNIARERGAQGNNARNPVPHGRGSGGMQTAPQTHTAPMASENETWDNIVGDAMRQSGLRT